MAETSLGFIGLGDMGGPMAGRLLDAGYALSVYDVRDDALQDAVAKGAYKAASPADLASREETVMVSLPTPDVVRQVALGPDGIIEGGVVRTYIDLSTSGAVTAKAVAEGLAAKGIGALDCPVSGGVRGAEAGTLSLMLSGPAELLEANRPALEVIGDNLFFIGGEAGLGQTMKLVNNFLSAANNIAAAEACVMGAKAGIDSSVLLEVINASSGRNSATADKYPYSVLTRSFAKSMKQKLLLKDVTLCLSEAEAMGVPMWLGSAVRQFLSYAVGQGTGDEASVSLIKHVEGWAGTEFGGEKYRS
ncbi:MAG: NAD(P)-dependent oxidoreductase [Alphaproteobacteria bacterium]|nr:NAD(P)-dependent oxidoreductase [Alphaproteobacteria bacterium]